MNVTSAQNSGLINVNRTLDSTPKVAGDIQGSGHPDQAELASGQEQNPAVAEATVSADTAAASTKVVNAADEVLGNLIDTRA